MNKEIYSQAKKGLIRKLENTLKGDAFLITENKTLPNEVRQERMKLIEEFLIYIRNYDKNKQLIWEYEDLKMRMIDDGR